MNHEHYLNRTLELAKIGAGKVSPNPLVGCVLVKNGKVIGEGYHKKFGGAHAEVEAIQAADEDTTGADLYVNLEPCSHFGKTPPCTDLIIKKKIKHVIIGTKDHNPLVAGQGIEKLLAAGIEVSIPICEEHSKELNRFFIKHISTGYPYVTLKVAASVNGKINNAAGVTTKITGIDAQRQVHQLRSEYDVVLTGVSTILIDNPLFNVRLTDGRNPCIAVLDTKLTTPAEAKIFTTGREAKIYIYTSQNHSVEKADALRKKGAEIIPVPTDAKGHTDIKNVLQNLGGRGHNSVLVEAGSKINTSFLEFGLVDEMRIYFSPDFFAGGENFVSPEFKGLRQEVEFVYTHGGSVGRDFFLELKTLQSKNHVYRIS